MLLTAIIKEFKLLWRDLHGLAVLFALPLVFMLIMSAALNNDNDPHKGVAAVLLGSADNALNQDLAEKLNQQGFEIDFQAALSDINEQAKEIIRHTDREMVLINPNATLGALEDDLPLSLVVRPNMDKAKLAGIQGVLRQQYSETRLQAYFNQDKQTALDLPDTVPAPFQNIINEQYQEKNAQRIDNITKYLEQQQFNAQFIDGTGQATQRPNSVQHSVPAWLIFGMFFILIPLSNVMIMEKNTNTIIRLRLSPAAAWQLIAAKFVPYFLINQIQFLLMIATGVWLLPHLSIPALQLSDSLKDYLLLSWAISFAALGYGLLVSIVAKTTEHAAVLGVGGIILMAAIGGIMVPSFVMPDLMRSLSQISPMAWGLSGFENLLLNRATIAEILPNILKLTAFGSICLIIATAVYARKMKTV